MSSPALSNATHEVIAAYGNTAKNLINAYRASGERALGFVDQQWERAFAAAAPKLPAEVQSNARHARDVATSYYSRGLVWSSDGATDVVGQLVKFAGKGVEQVAANASLFEVRTGSQALSKLSQATAPAAAVVIKLVTQIENKSAQLVEFVAGEKSAQTVVPKASAFRKARARKTA